MPETSAADAGRRQAEPARSRRHHGQMVPGERHRLFLHRRNHRHHHRGQVLLAGTAGHGAPPDIRAAPPAARQRHALRLAARRRHGADLLHRAPAVRRQAMEREARHSDRRALERHHPGRGGLRCSPATTRASNTPNCRCRSTSSWWSPGFCTASISSAPSRPASTSRCTSRSGTSWAPSCGPRSSTSPATSRSLTTGVNQANLNWMYVHNAVGLIFTPVGLAIAYYFIPKSSNSPLYSHQLSMIGFWALAFVYVWTGAHHMLHGPISQWLQTIAITFGDAADSGVGGGLQLLRHHERPVAPAARQRAAEVPDVRHGVLPADLFPGSDAQPAQRQRHRVQDRLDSGPRTHGRAGRLLVLRHRRHLLHGAARLATPGCTATRWRTGASGS